MKDLKSLVKGAVQIAAWIGSGIKGWFKKQDRRKP